ncbi:MAG: rhodanese-like domain-containing protein [Rhizobiales bacterium]|jgi:rhodanese-related sulfurtransferase|nr:rhodanese-like domain-containing protein [Hyphomicrobiales bacterium]MDQ3559027.1 rhodanese-like domain-containing protein [Pseudomonadota bacterium]
MSGGQYYAEATPEESWDVLLSEPGAALVDVRTTAEWAFVGLPDLSGAGASLLRVEWQSYPAMQLNPAFVETVDRELRAAGSGPGSPIFFICRSGARSAAAAAAMTAAGYSRCYNVAGGFEGNRDASGHRGTVEGWKSADLPWVQS